jgi:hypothetical protein
MHWDIDATYQTNKLLTPEIVDYFFQREIKYLPKFQKYSWAPKLIDIDIANKKIFLEWNSKFCNKIIFKDNLQLDDVCPNWRDQLYTILKNIQDSGYYKMSLYPHCFFLDNDNNLKTIDFYGCIEQSYPFVERSKLENIIGPDSVERFNSVTEHGLINFETLFKNTMLTHLATTWPDNPFPEFYRKLYEC